MRSCYLSKLPLQSIDLGLQPDSIDVRIRGDEPPAGCARAAGATAAAAAAAAVAGRSSAASDSAWTSPALLLKPFTSASSSHPQERSPPGPSSTCISRTHVGQSLIKC